MPGQDPTDPLTAVPSSQIVSLEVGGPGHGWIVGMLVGLAVDAIVLYRLSKVKVQRFCC